MTKISTTNFDNQEITAEIGKPICFKADVEQQAIVKDVRYGGFSNRPQILVDIEQGEYRAKNRWIDLERCWD